MRLPAALLALVLLAACTSHEGRREGASSPAPGPAGSPSATATAHAGPVQVVPIQDGAAQIESFQSPSHNLACSLGREEDGSGWIRCDVSAHSWQLPPAPEPCDADWGAVASVSTTGGKATMGACVSDAAGGEAVLAYGRTIRLGEAECSSAPAGMTCRVLTTHHGFFVSKASYRVF